MRPAMTYYRWAKHANYFLKSTSKLPASRNLQVYGHGTYLPTILADLPV